jgi:hypothetical protein
MANTLSKNLTKIISRKKDVEIVLSKLLSINNLYERLVS